MYEDDNEAMMSKERNRKRCSSEAEKSTSLNFEPPSKYMRKSIDDCIDPNTKHYLVTDASKIGWGAQLDNLSLCGEWPAAEQIFNANEKELAAILHVLRDYKQLLKSKTILIQSDCDAVVSLVQRKGSSKSPALRSLYEIVRRVIDELDIKISIHHIPGRFNYHADYLSRKKTPPEWHLLGRITEEVFHKWGTPTIDLFASSTAHVVEKYCTLNLQDTSAALHDAFSTKWHFPLAWVFPPPYLIPKVLEHMKTASGTYLIVTPRWKDMFWVATLKKIALAPPFTIPNLSEVLINTKTGCSPKNVKNLTLNVWKCKGRISTKSRQ